VAYLRDLNDLPRKTRLKVGRVIYVPDRTPLVQRSDRKAKYASKNEKHGVFHIVKTGDSLTSIAQKYQVSVSQLQNLNNLRRGKKLKVGMKVKLPSASVNMNSASQASLRPKVHIVQKGEKLFEIAARYNVLASILQEKNKISNPASLAVGAKLLIPSSEDTQKN
jgi:membrane-bound lytic murein transglycosylase D